VEWLQQQHHHDRPMATAAARQRHARRTPATLSAAHMKVQVGQLVNMGIRVRAENRRNMALRALCSHVT
jgi:hypothetical protein